MKRKSNKQTTDKKRAALMSELQRNSVKKEKRLLAEGKQWADDKENLSARNSSIKGANNSQELSLSKRVSLQPIDANTMGQFKMQIA